MSYNNNQGGQVSKSEKFADTIDSFFPNMKKKIKIALKMIPKQDRVPGEKVKDIPEITAELKEKVENFECECEGNMGNYRLLKEENNEFQKEINRTLKFGQYIAKKKNPYNGENARRDNAFKEIILKYKKKNYKIPDLSTEKNLFKPSALLIDNAELKQFFKIKKGTKDNKGFDEKETFFISKVNNLLYDRLKEFDSRVDPSKYKNLDKFQANSYQASLIGITSPVDKEDFSTKKVNELRKNIKDLKAANEQIKENISKLQENYDTLNDSDYQMKIKSIHSPKKKPKNKVLFEEFLKRLSRPKYDSGIVVVENKLQDPDELVKKITKRFSVFGGGSEANHPVGNKDKKGILGSFLKKLKLKGNKGPNTIFSALMGSTISTNFDSKNEMRSTIRTENVNASAINFFKKGKFGADMELRGDEAKKDFMRTNTKFIEKDNNFYEMQLLAEKEKLQEGIEAHLRTKDYDCAQFRDLMANYAKKHSHFEPKYIEDLINTRKIEPVHIMKGIAEIKNKIDYLDLKENYMDSFLSIGKFEQGATLMKIKNLDEKIGRLDLGLMKSVLKIDN